MMARYCNIFQAFLLLLSVAPASSRRWNPTSLIPHGNNVKHHSVEFARAAPTKNAEYPVSPEYERASSVRGGSQEEAKATILASVFNLVNNVAGAGILTLAAGMASGTGWIPAMLICAVLGLLSGHSFAIIGEACELTREADFKVL